MLLANPPYLHTYNYMDCPPDPIQRLAMNRFLGNGWSMSCEGSFPSSSALKVPSDLSDIFFCPYLTIKTMCIVTQKLKTLNGTIWAELHIQALKDFWFAENHILCSKGQLLPLIYMEEEVLKRIEPHYIIEIWNHWPLKRPSGALCIPPFYMSLLIETMC